MNPDEFVKVMQKGRVNIGWECCRVDEFIGVKRCFTDVQMVLKVCVVDRDI